MPLHPAAYATSGKLERARRLPGLLMLCALTLASVVAFAGSAEQGLDLTVSTTADAGPGSLREALEEAGRSPGPHRISFGSADGPFNTPQRIELTEPLPAITGKVNIDGFIPGLLWKAYGVTVSGADRHRVFLVAPGGELRLAGISIRDGRAENGGAVLNHGRLVAEGVTFLANQAEDAGGAVANAGGTAFLINSTLVSNRADRGGAVANLEGALQLRQVTTHANEAGQGSAVFSLDTLTLVNSILNDTDTACVNLGALGGDTSHNLFSSGRGCGQAITSGDPDFQSLGHYNGPTPTLPIGGRSPALNLGANEAAVDAEGKPLKWDQRGNGDPRFAGGYVDIGAFEHQSHLPTELVVDTVTDNGLRGCTRSGAANCPLRAAIELSLAGRHRVPIRFHPIVFAEPQVLYLHELPDGWDQTLVVDGSRSGGVTIVVPRDVPWQASNGVRIEVDQALARSLR